MEERKVEKTVHVNEIPNIIRALGYFPSEDEVENILNQVRFEDFVDKGEHKEKVAFDELIKCESLSVVQLSLGDSVQILTRCRRFS
jgi:Ca2+-binding EF-hand superfamily protein